MNAARGSNAWPGLIIALGLAAASACLVVPRAAQPRLLPMPVIDRVRQADLAAARSQRAEAARREGLPYLVRAAGEALRQVGAQAAGAREGDPAELRADLRERVARARKAHGDELLLRLRAVQAELFVSAADAFRRTGKQNADLAQLGGDFLDVFARRSDDHRPATLPGPDADLASAFVVRWAVLTGLSEHPPFAPTLTDWRAALRLWLMSPGRGTTPRDRALSRLEIVRILEQKDPDYPAALARGVLAYQAREYAASAAALRVYLDTHDSGPWQLRARNYLVAATERAPSVP